MRNASVGFHCPSCASVSPIDKRTQRKLRSFTGDPITTRALIALNALAFIWILISGGSVSSGGGRSTLDYGLVGFGRIREASQLIDVGVAEGEWWRLITSAFLHAGLLHFAVNMYLLWVLGQQLERLHGRSRYLGLYFGSLAAGSLGVMLLDPTALTVGASGAVFGLLAAFGYLFPNTQLMLLFPPIPIKAKFFVIGYAALELYLGFANNPSDNVAHFAHLGGALVGIIIVLYWQKNKNQFF